MEFLKESLREAFEQCPICNYEWRIAYKGTALKDGNEIIFWRKSCPNCGYVYPKKFY